MMLDRAACRRTYWNTISRDLIRLLRNSGHDHMGPRISIVYQDSPVHAKQLASLEIQLREATAANQRALAQQRQVLQAQLASQRHQFQIQVQQYEQSQVEVADQIKGLLQGLQEKSLSSLERLEECDIDRFKQIITLCQKVEPAPVISKHNVGFFGITSTGKSLLINSFIGEKVCAVGPGEVTREPCPYRSDVVGCDMTFWDLPGRNDELSYYTTTFIGLVKSLDSVGIVITESIKMMTEVTKLLDRLGVDYFYIRNKIDVILEEELELTKQQLEREIGRTGKPHDIYYVSALKPLHPHSRDSWRDLMDRLLRQH